MPRLFLKSGYLKSLSIYSHGMVIDWNIFKIAFEIKMNSCDPFI